jgi:hypothetical protein
MRRFAKGICRVQLPFGPLLLTLLTAAFMVPSEVSAYSPKEGNVLASLGFILHRTNFYGSHTGAKAPYSGGIALVVNGDVSDFGQLEVGLFHMNKQYFRDIGSRYVGQETEEIHITMGYRQWITPSFSAALAFSSAYSMGYVRELHNDYAPLPGIDTSASDSVEYGFDLSLQAELFSWGQRSAITMDAIYSLSVTGKPNEKADHYGLMISYRYFIQEKQVVDKPKTAI